MRHPSRILIAFASACIALAACAPLGPKVPVPDAPADEPAPSTTTAAAPSPTTTAAAADSPAENRAANRSDNAALVSQGDLVLVGSFTVPNEATNTETSLAYGGSGMAYNPANDSLFITGHDHHQRTAEIIIPATLGTGSVDDLPRSVYVQPPADATNGGLPRIADPELDGYGRIGGYLVVDGQLVISGYHYYDASNSQTQSHFVTDTTFSQTTDPFTMSGDVPPRWLGGPMATIPSAWQSAFGGDSYLTGLAGISIVSNSSVGPSAATFAADDVAGANSATLVVGYPLSQPLDVPEQQSDLWNLTSEVRGVTFPNGTDSVLFFGSHGTGAYCYGTGDECGDPTSPYKGTHAYPYRFQIWAYDAHDLADVYAGKRAPESLSPYDVWELQLPISSQTYQITGTAYDPATGRIFIGQGRADGDLPVIHVFAIR